jgi:hypothetical protein
LKKRRKQLERKNEVLADSADYYQAEYEKGCEHVVGLMETR